MRILPDFHFREHFKERYAENCEKINTKLEERAEAHQNRVPDSPEVIRYKIMGFVSSIIIIGSFFAVGIHINTKCSAKEQEIAMLEYKIEQADNLIKKYQIINGEEVAEQMDTIVRTVTDLQNQYAKQEFAEDFEVNAHRYLGNYDNDWSDGFDLSEPVWQGYINKAHEIGDTANFLFILYDNRTPVMIVDVAFDMDIAGNIGAMTSVRKTRLT